MLATVNTPAPTPTQYQRRQIGPRLKLIEDTPLHCEEVWRVLSKQPAARQSELIARFMYAPVEVSLEAQRHRVESRTVRRTIKADSVKAEHAKALAAIDAILKDDHRLENLCRDLIDRSEQHGPAALAARMFVQFCEILHLKIASTKGTALQRAPVHKTDAAMGSWLSDAHEEPGAVALVARYFAALADNIVEAELSPGNRLLIAANTAELVAVGVDPDATVSALAVNDDDAESQWSFSARTRQGARYRDGRLDAPADVEPELQPLAFELETTQ